jgi:uncharacterized protein YjiK
MTLGIRLKFNEKLDIRNHSAGLTEPSGLTMSRDGEGLWTVSDDTMTVFKRGPEGKLIGGASFAVRQVGFEGITLDETSDFLYVVQEGGNVLTKYSLQSKNPVLSRRLSTLEGYQEIGKYFFPGDKNKGLEGITVNTYTGTLFLLKEGNPGLLLEVTPESNELIEYRKLTKRRGFTDHNLDPHEIDYSGISYDATRNAFWIVSDKARRIYLYSWEDDAVLFDKALKYRKGDTKKTIKKAEGVAYDRVNKRLYIVSDEEACLYVYDIHEASARVVRE